MITKEELQQLLMSTETFRVERTVSTGDMDKFQEAICAFSNDLPGSKKNGYLIIGAHDNGKLSGLKVDDNLMKKISGIRSDGNILPLPVMSVEAFHFPEGDLLQRSRLRLHRPYATEAAHSYASVRVATLLPRQKNAYLQRGAHHIWPHSMPRLVSLPRLMTLTPST